MQQTKQFKKQGRVLLEGRSRIGRKNSTNIKKCLKFCQKETWNGGGRTKRTTKGIITKDKIFYLVK